MGLFKVNRLLRTLPPKLNELKACSEYAFIHHCDICGIKNTNPDKMTSYELETLMNNREATHRDWGRENYYFSQRIMYYQQLTDRVSTHFWTTEKRNIWREPDFFNAYWFKYEGDNRSRMIEIDAYITRLENFITLANIPEYKPRYGDLNLIKPTSLE